METSGRMVTAVSLNPCIDRTLTVNGLLPGGHYVAEEIQENVAGKGVDVNVVLRHLNVPTMALGFDFMRGGTQLADFLRQQGIPFLAHPVDAPLRVNTKIFDASAREMTEINCKGPNLTEREADAFLALLDQALDQTAILVACGSIPPGLPVDLYRKTVERAHARGVPAILDAAGPLLREGLKACPDVIKPNIGEMEALLGRSLVTRKEQLDACRALIAGGVGAVCLTLGGEGALMVTEKEAWFSPGMEIQVRGVQGAGDSVVAGICAAMLKSGECREWLRSGVAAAHGSLILPGTLLCEKAVYDRFLPLIPVEAA